MAIEAITAARNLELCKQLFAGQISSTSQRDNGELCISHFSGRQAGIFFGGGSKVLHDRFPRTNDLRANTLIQLNEIYNPGEQYVPTFSKPRDQRQIDPWLCRLCNATFQSLDVLKQHELLHAGQNLYPLKAGEAAFSRRSDLKRFHPEDNTNGSTLREAVRPSPDDLRPPKVRKLVPSGDNSYPNDYGGLYSRIDDLKRRTQIQSEAKPWQCNLCATSFSRLDDLREHERIHFRRNSDTIEFCDVSTSRSDGPRPHKRVPSEEKSHKSSNSSNVAFSRSDDFQRYKEIHTQEMLRDASFSREDDLSPHKRYYECCRYCDTPFTKQEDLKQHELDHLGRKRWSCDRCHKSFSTDYELQGHKRIHFAESILDCNICKATFSSEEDVKRHKLIHYEGKRWKCDFCESTFSTQVDLEAHKENHTGKKIWECKLCMKKCKTRNGLRLHDASHTESFKRFLNPE